jgi:hypothetical protein
MTFRFPIFFWLWLCERASPPERMSVARVNDTSHARGHDKSQPMP